MPFFGLKWGQDLENRAAHPHQEFPGVPPSRGFKVAQPANTAVAPRSDPCHLGPSLGRKPLSYADLGISGTPGHPDQEGEGGGGQSPKNFFGPAGLSLV